MKVLEWSVYAGDMLNKRQPDDIFVLGLGAPFDGQQELNYLHKDFSLNSTYWMNEEYHKLFDELKVALDPAKRADLMAKMWAIAYDDPPWIYVWHQVDFYGVSKRLEWEARNGVVARRNNFNEPILKFLEEAYEEFGRLTGRYYGLVHQYKCEDADTVFVSLGCAADNIEAACDYLRDQRNAKVGSIHINVIRPFPEAAVIDAPAAIANGWLTPAFGRGWPRGFDSLTRQCLMAACQAEEDCDGLDWLQPPIANPFTRLAALLDPARGRLTLQGWERTGPVTQILQLAA